MAMGVYVIHPALTIGPLPEAVRFYDTCLAELEQHVDVTGIRSRNAAADAVLSKHDAVVLFNRSDTYYADEVIELLTTAKEVGADIIGIAMTADCRTPATAATTLQGFDVTDQLRRRCLTSEQLETVALTLARALISKVQPTLTKDRMHLFISYRRADGEDMAAALCGQLRTRAEKAFRDLVDIHLGEDAQEVIERELCDSDAVLFLDTPRVGESAWIEKELEMALGLNLPIVWIRVGPEEGRAPLTIRPTTGTPHFQWPDFVAESLGNDPAIVDKFLHEAFELSRSTTLRVFEDVRRLKTLSRTHAVQVQEVDRRNMVFSVEIPRARFRYRQRPMSHLVQFYGRRPSAEDLRRFSLLSTTDVTPRHVRYDAELILSPIPEQGMTRVEGDMPFVDSCGDYIRSIQSYLQGSDMPGNAAKRGVIISGAFPDCEPDYQQHVTEAVHAFTAALLERSGSVIFGAHPTFQHLIFDLAKRRQPTDYQKAVRLYVSRLFVTDALINEFREKATVFPTEAVNGQRADSLTNMRKAMLADATATALIAIGGKTPTGGRTPGVDEEIELARAVGLPVFLIGSAGGRTAQIATEFSGRGWGDKVNNLSAADNDSLLTRIDYRIMADEILSHLGL